MKIEVGLALDYVFIEEVVNWQAIGAVGEIIGGLAVVFSLIYVATQIRTQNRDSRIAAVHEVNEAFRAAITSFQDPELAEIFARARNGIDELSETERLQFISIVQGIFRVWEDAFYQYGHKRLDEQLWKGMVVQFSGYLSLPGVMRVWEIRKQAYNDEFRKFVDSTDAIDYVTK